MVFLSLRSAEGQARISDSLDALLGWIGGKAAWLFLATVAVICWDVVSRKLNIQIPGVGSTKLQELEWHFHAVLFSLWIGYGYVKNCHVRIDILTGGLSPRNAALLEVACGLVFAVPYSIVVCDFSIDFAWRSFLQGETSDAPTGLPYRFIVKAFLCAGMLLLLTGVVSVLLRRVAFLRGYAAALPAGAKTGH